MGELCRDQEPGQTDGAIALLRRRLVAAQRPAAISRATPGETVQIREGRVYVNGAKLDEAYIAEFCRAGCDGTWTLKNDEYFVLGDNRPNSFDSHSFGPIARSLIVGEAWIRYWPPQDVGVIQRPAYGVIPQSGALPTLIPTVVPGNPT